MAIGPANSLVELRLRDGEVQLSRGRTAFVANSVGVVLDGPHHGLLVYQTRVLGRYRWLMNGREPEFSCGSKIEQHSWMGYFIQAPENWQETPSSESSPLQQTVELRLSRSVGEGMLEEVQLTNYTQISTKVRLELEFEPQFASPQKRANQPKPHGRLSSHWRELDPGAWELDFRYKAEHHYEHQGNVGDACLDRGLTLRITCADSSPEHFDHAIRFDVSLAPHRTWRCCLSWLARLEERPLPLSAKCFHHGATEYERKRLRYLRTATSFGFGKDDLSDVVRKSTERARLDLAALRMFDLERDGKIAVAAGIPTYMGVFGRDMLASAWQASLLGPELALGSVDVLARSQASEENPWRDAVPGKIVHEMHTDPLSVLNFRPKSAYYGSVSGSFLYPLLVSELWHWTGDLDSIRP